MKTKVISTFSAVGSVILIALFAIALSQSASIDKLAATNGKQEASLKSLATKVTALQKGNPNLLADCNNKASTTYLNYISTNGAPERGTQGQVAYRMDESEWKKAADALKTTQKHCQDLYGI